MTMTLSENDPEFSLIISTLGAAERLRQGLTSILTQTYGSFEVIIVDQNEDDHVRRMIEPFLVTRKLHYIKSQVGLSKGRNAGLLMARGRIVSFPDDDCQYPATLLADVKAQFLRHPDASGICVRCCDHNGHDSAGRSDRICGFITKSNIWRRAVSIGIFLKIDAVKEAGNFDENLGLGSNTPYQSGEETDMLLRVISRGRKVYYESCLNVFHPRDLQKITSNHIKRAYAYGLAMGLLLRRYNFRKREIALHCARPVLGALLALISGNLGLARLRCARAWGRLDGWKSSLPSAINQE